jgi:hypothetical protein
MRSSKQNANYERHHQCQQRNKWNNNIIEASQNVLVKKKEQLQNKNQENFKYIHMEAYSLVHIIFNCV